jgi:hypothetical protein
MINIQLLTMNIYKIRSSHWFSSLAIIVLGSLAYNPVHAASVTIDFTENALPAGTGGDPGKPDLFKITSTAGVGKIIDSISITFIDTTPGDGKFMFFDTVAVGGANNGYPGAGVNNPGFSGWSGFLPQLGAANVGYTGNVFQYNAAAVDNDATGDGAVGIVLAFNNFENGEKFDFSIDIDGWNGAGVDKGNPAFVFGTLVAQVCDAPGLGCVNESISISGSTVSAIPLPATVWLFGSGLIGLISITRRKMIAV